MSDIFAHLRSVAPDIADVPILQPADPFLETAGEDLRRRIFLTESTGGALNCLRPEFTIPICRRHIEDAPRPARYAYAGTVFRQERAGSSEFSQAGLEDLGSPNIAAADAACIADMIEALKMGGLTDFTITLGDQALFDVVVENLALPGPIAARLKRNFGEQERLATLLDELSSHVQETGNGSDIAGQLARNGDVDGLEAHVEGLMALASLSARAGRNPRSIAKRAIAKASGNLFRLDSAHAATLRTFLELEAPLAMAGEELARFGKDHGVNFGTALTAFDDRTQRLAERGCSLGTVTWKASFGRKLDYYSGVLFEAHVKVLGEPVAGGGRYDRLCNLLGSETAIPAIGFSISIDRLEEALS